MKIVFATNNAHKLEEAAYILGPDFQLVTLAEVGLTGDIPETEPTLEGNALLKARWVYERTGLDCFADDTGLEVEALGGAPGVRSARYASDAGGTGNAGRGAQAGDRHDFAANTRLLMHNMEGVADRSARFRTVVALIRQGREYLFEGEVRGHITEQADGTGGFGYDPVFVPEGSAHTFARMTPAEKNRISHRARAMARLAEFLKR